MAWAFRAIVAFATLVGLPMAGYMLDRAVRSIDGVAVESIAHTVQLNGVTTKLDFLTGIATDHETRLRQLERTAPR